MPKRIKKTPNKSPKKALKKTLKPLSRGWRTRTACPRRHSPEAAKTRPDALQSRKGERHDASYDPKVRRQRPADAQRPCGRHA